MTDAFINRLKKKVTPICCLSDVVREGEKYAFQGQSQIIIDCECSAWLFFSFFQRESPINKPRGPGEEHSAVQGGQGMIFNIDTLSGKLI